MGIFNRFDEHDETDEFKRAMRKLIKQEVATEQSEQRLPPNFPPKPFHPKNVGNPDPKNFRIDFAEQIGQYLLVKINYPDCRNFEGDKILVFDGVTKAQLLSQKRVDPHFDTKGIVPIARFEPTPKGIRMARFLCQTLSQPGVGY